MDPYLIDMNSHLSFYTEEQFKQVMESPDRTAKRILISGVSPLQFSNQLRYHAQCPTDLLMGLGLHPWYVCKKISQGSPIAELLAMFNQPLQQCSEKIHFIGELGLDFSKPEYKEKKDEQLEALRQVFQMIDGFDRPVLLHVVSAHGEMIELISEFSDLRFIVHGFSGSLEVAKRYMRHNVLFTVGHGALSENFKKLQECLKDQSFLEKVMFETDLPATPEMPEDYNHRLIPDVVSHISKVSGLEPQTLIDRAEEHFLELFT